MGLEWGILAVSLLWFVLVIRKFHHAMRWRGANAYPWHFAQRAYSERHERVPVGQGPFGSLQSIERRSYPEYGFAWRDQWDECDIEGLYRAEAFHQYYKNNLVTELSLYGGIMGVIGALIAGFEMNLFPPMIFLLMLLGFPMGAIALLEILTGGRFLRGRRLLKQRRAAVRALYMRANGIDKLP